MNTVTSVAVAVSGGNQPQCCQRQNPQQQAMQQILSYIQGLMVGQMMGQMLNGNQGCMCSGNQNPNFGGLNNANGLGFGPPNFSTGGAGFANPGLGFGPPNFSTGGAGFAAPGLGTSGLGFAAPNLSTAAIPASSAGIFQGLPSLGLGGGVNSNSLYNGLPGGLTGVPNPYEVGQPITGLASGLPPLAFNVLGQNPNPGFAGGNNILGIPQNVFIPQLQDSLGSTIIPAGSGIPGAFGNNLGGFLG